MMIIVYLNFNAFAVNREAYLAKVKESEGEWTRIAEWIEEVGTFLGSRPRPQNSLLPFEWDRAGSRDGSATQDSISHLPYRL